MVSAHMLEHLVTRGLKTDWNSLLFLQDEFGSTHLLESLVIHKTCRILRNLELAFLNLLAKLPKREQDISVGVQ
jgi:hypothetical protein